MSKLFSLPRFAAVLLTVVVLHFASSATAQDPDYYLLPVTATSGATTLTFSGEITASGAAELGLQQGNGTVAINTFTLNDGTQTYTATHDIQIQSLGFSSSNDPAFDLQTAGAGGDLIVYKDTDGTVTLSGETVAGKTISVTWSISANEVVVTDPLGTYTNTDGTATYGSTPWTVAMPPTLPAVPEPSTIVGLVSLSTMGLVGMVRYRRRCKTT